METVLPMSDRLKEAVPQRGLHRLLVRGVLFGFVLALPVLASLSYLDLPRKSRGERPGGRILFEVGPGQSASSVAHKLQDQGIVRSARSFMILSRLLLADHRLRAGHYLLDPSMSPHEIVRILVEGRVATVRVTVPEGESLRQIAARLERGGLVTTEGFIRAANDSHLIYGDGAAPVPAGSSLEGYLFPDTYLFELGMSEKDIIRRMVSRFQEKVLPVWEKASSQSGWPPETGLTQVVILASIVEEEAAVESERSLIASVFLNRLKQGMPLQADPTVRYALGKFEGPLMLQDLESSSPYNTYRFRGLPPGPISNPGLPSITAVLYPAHTPFLFFVARGDGSHVFTRSYPEHLAARRSLRLRR